MIYLIGGPPKGGKTTLAKKLSKAINISWISGDILRQIARKYADPSRHAEMFPMNMLSKKMSKDRETTFPKIAEMIADYSKYFEVEAKEYGFKALNMDNDFDNQINEAIAYLRNNS